MLWNQDQASFPQKQRFGTGAYLGRDLGCTQLYTMKEVIQWRQGGR